MFLTFNGDDAYQENEEETASNQTNNNYDNQIFFLLRIFLSFYLLVKYYFRADLRRSSGVSVTGEVVV